VQRYKIFVFVPNFLFQKWAKFNLKAKNESSNAKKQGKIWPIRENALNLHR
jgi:hypothetical protein